MDRRWIALLAATTAFIAACFAPPPQIVAVALGFISGMVGGVVMFLEPREAKGASDAK